MKARSLAEIEPPLCLAGAITPVLSNGRWVDAEVTKVELVRQSRLRIWQWAYHVQINGVSVVRYSGEGTI